MIPYQSESDLQQHSFRCTVVIPVTDDDVRLRILLSSLLSQTMAHNEFEIIVCDDGSSKPASEVISEYPTIQQLRCLRQDCRGLAAARNLGVIHANSSIVIFLDCDVEPDEQLIARLVSAMEDNPLWSGAAPGIVYRKASDSNLKLRIPLASTELGIGAVAYRTAAIRAVGGFNEIFKDSKIQLLEIVQRIREIGNIGFVPNATVFQKVPSRTVAGSWASKDEWRYRALMSKQTCGASRSETFPRLRAVWAALVNAPVRAAMCSLRSIRFGPFRLAQELFLVLVDWLGALWVTPQVLLDATPERLAYVEPINRSRQRTPASKAS